MANKDHEFFDWLSSCLTVLHASLEEDIRAHFSADGICFPSLRADIDAPTVRQLVKIFSSDRRLWSDFQNAILAHRRAHHWEVLIEHALFIGQRYAMLASLHDQLVSSLREHRQGLSHYLNRIDGETGWFRDMADRRDLALRITERAGIPLIDGFSLRVLTFLFGEYRIVWRAFASLVEGLSDSAEPRDASRNFSA